MSLISVLLSVGISLFVWMYLLTYFMHLGAQKDFFIRARDAVLRGVGIAVVLLLVQRFFPDVLRDFQWIIVPVIFFIGGQPFLWQRWRYISLLPLVFGVMIYGSILFGLQHVFIADVGQTPFYEEVGKWFQSMVYAYPAVMSPFIALGFGFGENIAYFSHEFTWSQFFGRTFFSVPMHMFAGFFGLWCLFRVRPVWFGALLGCLGAVVVHTLYNWSLSTSLFITLILMIGGYIFYGWSLENAWWKRLSDSIRR